MRTNLVLAVVVVASLAGGVAQAADMARALDINSRRGHRASVRMQSANTEPVTEEQMAKVRHDRLKRKGEEAGTEAVVAAGIHAAKLKDAEVMRRAKLAVKATKLSGEDAESFVSGFAAAFTTSRMNAR